MKRVQNNTALSLSYQNKSTKQFFRMIFNNAMTRAFLIPRIEKMRLMICFTTVQYIESSTLNCHKLI